VIKSDAVSVFPRRLEKKFSENKRSLKVTRSQNNLDLLISKKFAPPPTDALNNYS